MYAFINTHLYIHIYVCAYIHIYICVYICIYICVYVQWVGPIQIRITPRRCHQQQPTPSYTLTTACPTARTRWRHRTTEHCKPHIPHFSDVLTAQCARLESLPPLYVYVKESLPPFYICGIPRRLSRERRRGV